MLKKLLIISFVFFNYFGFSQNWEFATTDANMTIQVGQEVVTFDNEEPPCGSFLGGFFINDSGNLVCGGYQIWCDDFSNNQLAIPLMASESGLDNGFAAGEEINWLLQVDGQSYQAAVSVMNEGGQLGMSSTFTPNGFGQVLDLDFFSSGCSDSSACNYCNSCVSFDDDLCEYPPIY